MIYIDSKYRCHTANLDNTLREMEHSFFIGKCNTFIEGYRFVPYDGVIFSNEMISSFKSYDELDSLVLQLQYNNLIK